MSENQEKQEDSVEITDYDENQEDTPAPVPAPAQVPAPVTKKQVDATTKTQTTVDVKSDEDGEFEYEAPKNLIENLFRNLDVNGNNVIDVGDLTLLLSDYGLEERVKQFEFENDEDISIEEIIEFLTDNFNEKELKLVLFHEKLHFVSTVYQQTNEGGILTLYRVFDALNIDRGYVFVEDDKYLKEDGSGVTKEKLRQILEHLDRKSLLKLLNLQHVEEEDVLFTWSTFFKLWKLGDVVFWCICTIVLLDGYGDELPCRSKVAHFFAAYIVLKGINYSFEVCLTGCSCFFKHPNRFETRYIISFPPLLSWLFSITVRQAVVLGALFEVASTSSDCNDQITDDHTALYTFFWWAMVYECVSLGMFIITWTSLPCWTLYLLAIAIRPRVDDGKANQGDLQEPLTEFCKEQFHKHIRSGDSLYEFFLGITGLNVIVKKNDLARLLVTSSQEQKLSKKDVMLWSTDDVFNWLKSLDMEKYANKFVKDGITGNLLLTHVDPDLLHRGFGIKKVDADFIWQKLNELRKPTTVGSWSVNEVCDWLCRVNMAQYMEDFRKLQITGLMLLSHDDRLAQVLLTIPVYHRHQLIAEMKILRNEGAPMTVGEQFGRHPLNYHGAPLAIQQKGDYTVLEQKTGLRSAQMNDLRDVETLTPLVTDTVEQESQNAI